SERFDAMTRKAYINFFSLSIVIAGLLFVIYRVVKSDLQNRQALAAEMSKSRDLALESSRLKSEFLATMSHEIRTPMNGIIGMTALLRDTPLTPAQAEYVRTIESSGESLLGIINDILDYSKIEAGRIELEIAP